jgi:DNA invertase Pin-like site-specific DNA recombinase
MSQTGEGWTALPAHYDDGGFSGGNMERPGLKQLLADIALRKIDVVVVYKVDRLTRSLADFARIVDVLDQNGVSFVSVTQAFNTTSSMGRLTLNVLLSFAQFEREVTGERIRDKIAASKKKGMWMGGTPPLGYRPHERTLAIDEEEAARVRHIFERYLALRSVHLLKDDLAAHGIGSKPTASAHEAQRPFSRGALYHLLSNRIYVGEIVHKDASYPGLHEPIIERAIFDQVQALLAENRKERRDRTVTIAKSPLTGILFDNQGRRLCPVSARNDRGRIYRYYVSAHLQQGGRRAANDDLRISAPTLEALVLDAVRKRLPTVMNWDDARGVLTGVTIDDEGAEIRCRPTPASDELELRVPVRIAPWAGSNEISRPPKRRPAGIVDHSLVRGLSRAHALVRSAKADPDLTLSELAGASSRADSYVRRLARLAFLAPDIQQAIVEGRQRNGVSLERLMRIDLPLNWIDQRRLLGFA